ncbi:2-oxo acid dehydrogenase subunit E2 [Microbulbifer sp. OS29]|uniref:Dihydrolipoamide acetyltransferase component of pyruvate dehydrogenase complex n=1 Tax=Microbulbifer okhotskensis TaxID=2926617 RepID=A0A9X2ETA4_9GAMM|nr:dihydrolipoamide acetyltransferase family protein [Microbulbifer okhotskensis]MCO1335316.1 2-oxo acid dehydrogenase subunit E2 [Microbulbifer okhotskensis]
MKIFSLPDLGEGLPDAVVREWHVSEGDNISAHESLVTVETAKALVEVPAPWGGKVEKLFAGVDEIVNVGDPLIGFVEALAGVEVPAPAASQDSATAAAGQQTEEEAPLETRADSGTVVGKLMEGAAVLGEERPITQMPERLATPSVRALARRLGVDLLQLCQGDGMVNATQVRAVATKLPKPLNRSSAASSTADSTREEAGLMSPARRAMAMSMSRARDQVTRITLCDDADISNWWGSTPALLRLIRAVQEASNIEPTLNALYENEQLELQKSINIGLAVDSPRGLFVPVLKDVGLRSDEDLVQQVADFKYQARETGIAQSDLQGASILLSNFGSIAGRYATPVVMPPTVAIVGAGRVCQGVVVVNRWPALRPLLPLSISADHRAVTGGELARFLKAMLESLSL